MSMSAGVGSLQQDTVSGITTNAMDIDPPAQPEINISNVNNDSSDDEDSMPLAQRYQRQQQEQTAPMKMEQKSDSDDDDDVPLSARMKKSLSPSNTASTPVSKTTTDADDESEDDDDIPLAKRALHHKGIKQEESSDDEDDVPLALRKKGTAPIKTESKPTLKSEPMDVDTKSPLTKKRPLSRSQSNSSSMKTKQENGGEPSKKKVKKEEDDPTLYKWWEEEQNNEFKEDDSIKWTTLEHQGVLFPPEYVPHGVKMKYDGQPITLSPEAEEVATFFAALLETDHGKNPVFQKNFFNDWQEILKKDPKNPTITAFEKCNFRPIWEKLERDKEKKKSMTKEEKQRIKAEKEKLEAPYLYAIVDGRKEKVGNFRIEPPGLFRGRGSHPKTGKLKQRVKPEQITLNLGKDAPIPDPPKGHKWAAVVHDQTATWLATWKENVNGSTKYVFLAATSAWKGQSDMQKFDKARELKKVVNKIRADYRRELRDKLMEVRQRATAMYLIDQLALRAGNEKGDDEADTVGCCSLRYEHIELIPPQTLHFDFLGKDSIRYVKDVQVDAQVFKNIRIFKKQVGEGNMIFDRLTPASLNKHLNSYMKGLSAKVFRTFNASHTFEIQLEKLTNPEDSMADKLLSYNRANREVAVLCNHQRAVSKSHADMIARIQERIRALKYQRMKLRKQLFYVDAKYKKDPEYSDLESDIDDEWILKHEEDLVLKEKDKIMNKFQRENEKLKLEKQPILAETVLKERLKAADELDKKLKEERKLKAIEPKTSSTTAEKIIERIHKVDERIAATKNQATDKEENKEIALGTSKLNYIDPRISVVWCKKNDVPLEKVFSKTLIEKFRWALNVPENWKF